MNQAATRPSTQAEDWRLLQCWVLDEFFYDTDSETEDDLRTDELLAAMFDPNTDTVPEVLMANRTSDYDSMSQREIREEVWTRFNFSELVYFLGKDGQDGKHWNKSFYPAAGG